MDTRAYTIEFSGGTTIVVTADGPFDTLSIIEWALKEKRGKIHSISYKYVAKHFAPTEGWV